MINKQKLHHRGLHIPSEEKPLMELLNKAKKTCFELNNICPTEYDKKNEIYQQFFGQTNGFVVIQPPFWCDFGFNIHVGKNFYANHGLTILDCASVIFGDNVLIGPNCGFHTAGHAIDYERRISGQEFAHPIIVGDGVWFGAGVQVLPGVSIGNNVVIASGSIVNKDIPDNVIAGGNPCKVIRPITEADKLRDFEYKSVK